MPDSAHDARLASPVEAPATEVHGATEDHEVMGRHGGTGRARLPLWLLATIVLVVSLLAEVFVCNFNHWASLGYEEVVLRDEPITVSKADYSIGFGNLDVDAKNLKIVVSLPEGAPERSSVWFEASVTDDGDSVAYDLPVAQMNPGVERSEVHRIYVYGNLHSIRITFPEVAYGGVSGRRLIAANEFPIVIESVSLNARVPFEFSWLRFILIAGGLLVLAGCRPGGALSRIPALSTGMPARMVRGSMLTTVLVLLVVFAVSVPRWSGIATSFYNQQEYDETLDEAIQLVGQPDTATNEYAKLAVAFTRGQLDLLQTPPAWLNEMEDPYMYGARTQESSQQLRGYLWDTAYYEGNYYVYFGVLPVLVFYLPFYLLTGEYFPNSVAVLVASLLFVVGWYSLLRALVRHRFTRASLSTFVLVFLGVACASGLIFGLGRPGLYNVPVTCARCLAVWGLAMWYRGWHVQSPVRMAIGSLLIALIAATRPQLLVFAPLVFLLLFLTIRSTGLSTRRKVGWSCALMVPMVVVALGVMWYNAARFGSPFDFGANYNLTYNNMTMRGTSVYRMIEGAFYSLLSLPSVSTSFPFIAEANVMPGFPGITTYEPIMGGLIALNPMLLSLVLVGSLRHRDRDLFWVALYLLLMGVVLVVFDTDNAGILLRYFQDFGFVFALAGSLVFLHHMGGEGSRHPDEFVAYAEVASDSSADGSSVVGSGANCPGASDQPVSGAEAPAVAVEGRSGWAVALFAAVLVGLATTLLAVLFMHDPTNGLSTGGSTPQTWEWMRQTFMFWL